MSEVFLCPKGQLTGPAKHDLRKVGVVVVEVDDPSQCQFIRSAERVSGDEMLWAVLDALNRKAYYQSGSSKGHRASSSDHEVKMDALAANLLKIVTDARAPKDDAP